MQSSLISCNLFSNHSELVYMHIFLCISISGKYIYIVIYVFFYEKGR